MVIFQSFLYDQRLTDRPIVSLWKPARRLWVSRSLAQSRSQSDKWLVYWRFTTHQNWRFIGFTNIYHAFNWWSFYDFYAILRGKTDEHGYEPVDAMGYNMNPIKNGSSEWMWHDDNPKWRAYFSGGLKAPTSCGYIGIFMDIDGFELIRADSSWFELIRAPAGWH